MSYDLRRYPLKGVQALIIGGVTLVLLVSALYVFLGGNEHYIPERKPWGYETVTICPSAAWAWEEFREAEARYAEQCVPLPQIHLGACAMPPASGEAQVRDHRDQVVGWTADVGGAYVDRIAHVDDTAVAYLLESHSIRPCTPGHVLGHLLGYREHATAATSIMADPCGDAYHHLSECPDE